MTDEVGSVRGVISDPEAVAEEVADRTDLDAIPLAPLLDSESRTVLVRGDTEVGN